MKDKLKIILKEVVSNAIENLAKDSGNRQSIVNIIIFETEIEKILDNAEETEQLPGDSE